MNRPLFTYSVGVDRIKGMSTINHRQEHICQAAVFILIAFRPRSAPSRPPDIILDGRHFISHSGCCCCCCKIFHVLCMAQQSSNCTSRLLYLLTDRRQQKPSEGNYSLSARLFLYLNLIAGVGGGLDQSLGKLKRNEPLAERFYLWSLFLSLVPQQSLSGAVAVEGGVALTADINTYGERE